MSGSSPAWFAKWLGVEASAAGEGVRWRLSADWGLAPWATLLFLVALVLWVAYCYARTAHRASRRVRFVLVACRLIALGVLLLMIAQTKLLLQRTGLPKVALLVDHSLSMGTADATARTEAKDPGESTDPNFTIPSRLELAKQFLLENDARCLNEIAEKHDIEAFAIATSAKTLGRDLNELNATLPTLSSDAPGSDATRLGAAVRQVLADLQGSATSALVLFSDGVSTQGESLIDAAKLAASQGVPLFTVGVGSAQGVRDIELSDLLVDDMVFVGDVAPFEAMVTAQGLEGDSAVVELTRRGDKAVLDATTITLGANQKRVKTRLQYRPEQTGDYEFTVRVRPVDGEIQTANNAQTRVVSVRDAKVRVLLAASVPSYEFRFLKNMLERDDSIDLNVFLQDADPDYAVDDKAAVPVFPIQADALFEYDVLILDDVDLRRLTRQSIANIHTFVVEKGGGLVWIAGDRFSREQLHELRELAGLLPFSPSVASERRTAQDGFQMRLTEIGEQSAATQIGEHPDQTAKVWRSLPPLYWFYEIDDPKPAARVLAEHPTRRGRTGRPLPLIMTQYVGAGRVLFHATDETWRWRRRVGDAYFARYWVQAIRQLARSKLLDGARGVEISTDRTTYHLGEPVRIRARFFDESLTPRGDVVDVSVDRDGDRKQRMELRRHETAHGVFEATAAGLSPGRYGATLSQLSSGGAAPSADFRVVAPPGELERLQMDATALAAAAEVSRGKYYSIENAEELVNDLPKGRYVPIEQLPPVALWNRWWMIAVFVGALISEWVIRKRMGMM